ncbi:MAG: UPF0175 family protein [Methanimicrococcus sp.]|nr:UPF0175 family protein [Methanimicrococcus sp.]
MSSSKSAYKEAIMSQIINDLSELDVTILQLLAANEKEPVKGQVAYQKEMFLIANYCDRIMEETDFEAHNFGSHSEILENSINMLEQNKLVKTDGQKIFLTDFGEQALLKSHSKIIVENEAIEDFKELLNDLTDDEICLIVYALKPEYAAESIVKGDIFKKRVKNSISLYSKGKVSLSKAAYLAGMNIEDFLKKTRDVC